MMMFHTLESELQVEHTKCVTELATVQRKLETAEVALVVPGATALLTSARAATTHAAALLGAVTHAANNHKVETTLDGGKIVFTIGCHREFYVYDVAGHGRSSNAS